MALIPVIHVDIDDAQPLGPQVAAARALNVEWKLLERATGKSRRWLYALMVDALQGGKRPALPIIGNTPDARARAH